MGNPGERYELDAELDGRGLAARLADGAADGVAGTVARDLAASELAPPLPSHNYAHPDLGRLREVARLQNDERVRQHVRPLVAQLLEALDPDHEREGLEETPRRVADAYAELTAGYATDPGAVLTTFPSEGYDEMVLVRDIPVWSLCEHHLLPFTGVAHVGYIPGERIIGLSKLPRIVEVFARRLQVQERLTAQVADALVEHLEPLGAICVVEAEHTCMAMRGVRVAGSTTQTSALRGVFKDQPATRAEAMSLIANSRRRA